MSFVKEILTTSKITRPIYKKYLKYKYKHVDIESLNSIVPSAEQGDLYRYNLVLPTLEKRNVYGGIATAIKVFRLLSDKSGYCSRIIITDDKGYSKKYTYDIEGFSNEKGSSKQMVFLKSNQKVEVRKNDIFILTSWSTAYMFTSIIDWQIESFALRNRKAVYIIQDYEPGFFAWSSNYVLAESTYRSSPDKLIALFNSRELYEYFKLKKYNFYKALYFEPALNDELKKYLLKAGKVERKKHILIYGRPYSARNAFEIIKEALSIWSKCYKDAKDWCIISLGADFENIALSNNTIESLGKVSLKEYADIMLESYAGISLMISPHPSYPPLEMSTFGVRTITNSFENKDLSYFSKNIISIDNCAPEVIAHQLESICNEYGRIESAIDLDSPYVKGSNIDSVISELGVEIDEMVSKDQK